MLLWTILALPLISFLLITLVFPRRHSLAGLISVGSAVLNALLTFYVAFEAPDARAPVLSWIEIGKLQLDLGIKWDDLSRLMLLIVTGIGALIHVYSLAYMREDGARDRYFGYLSLFMFSMIGIVLADNLVGMFIFWELVGLSSYLLIGFWFQKASAAEAGKKAFLVNKLGDFGFLLGIVMVWSIWGTVNFDSLRAASDLAQAHQNSAYSAIPLGVITLLLFCGTLGKSAQFPLHVWLPDAMEGPTPVSALIHAATMVAAGVYMLCRIFFILELAPDALRIIAWTGGATALLAALWAIAQDDIKRILAYSTLSQLGYMVMAVGMGSPWSAMLHLSTHACFKALLFLAAGSVIMALHHEQNIWRMGGLLGKMKATSITFLVGLLALAGFPFTAGAISKDQILEIAHGQSPVLFYLAAFTAFLTAFYMTRLFVVAFLNPSRTQEASHAKENSPVVTVPLLVLAFLSLPFIWYMGPESLLVGAQRLLQGGAAAAGDAHLSHLILALIPVAGFTVGGLVYLRKQTEPLETGFRPLYRLLASRFYFDELYDFGIRYTQGKIAGVFRFIDIYLIDGLGVKGTSLFTLLAGNVLRCFQTGNLQTYVLFLGIALASLILFTILRA